MYLNLEGADTNYNGVSISGVGPQAIFTFASLFFYILHLICKVNRIFNKKKNKKSQIIHYEMWDNKGHEFLNTEDGAAGLGWLLGPARKKDA